jgi:hypothetical protein
MNDPLDRVAQLAAAAQNEPIPRVDIAADVMRQIRMLRAERRVWIAAATLAAATAVIVGVISLPVWNALNDPLNWLYRWDYLNLL